VTVTHPDAERFLMTIPEAVSLLIQAGVLANNRDIFILDMGAPVVIQKLAEELIELSGLSPNRDIRIEITGLKRGEKLSEVLLEHPAELRSTQIEKIKAIRARGFEVAAFKTRLQALERSAWDGDVEETYRLLGDMNIGYAVQLPPRAWPASSPKAFPVTAVGRTLAPETSYSSSNWNLIESPHGVEHDRHHILVANGSIDHQVVQASRRPVGIEVVLDEQHALTVHRIHKVFGIRPAPALFLYSPHLLSSRRIKEDVKHV